MYHLCIEAQAGLKQHMGTSDNSGVCMYYTFT